MSSKPVEVKKTVPAQVPTPARMPDPMYHFRREMDRLFDRFTNAFDFPTFRSLSNVEPFWPRVASQVALPAVDVAEDTKAYSVSVELPGMEEKDVQVEVSGDVLTIKGEKHQEKEEKDKNRYLSERTYGSFQRSFELTDEIDRNAIGAAFGKGVLTITLPKTAQAQTVKKIDVKAA